MVVVQGSTTPAQPFDRSPQLTTTISENLSAIFIVYVLTGLFDSEAKIRLLPLPVLSAVTEVEPF